MDPRDGVAVKAGTQDLKLTKSILLKNPFPKMDFTYIPAKVESTVIF